MSKVHFTGDQAQFKPVVKGLQLENFRGFSQLDISLQEDLTVFISRNGGGKSTFLDAIWASLEVFEKLFGGKKQPKRIGWLKSSDIKNGTEGSSISVVTLTHFQWLQKEDENEEEDYGSINTLEKGKKESTIRIKGSELGFELTSDLSKDWPELSEYLKYGAQQGDSRPIFKYYQPQGRKPELPAENKLAKLINWIDRRQKVVMQSTYKPFKWELDWVKEAVSGLLSDDEVTYTDLKVKYSAEGSDFLSITKRQGKQAEELSAQQLSSGEISLLEIVADIAISLIEANPDHGEDFNPLTDGFGVVLIDEVGMHLHPGWQRNVLPSLQKAFPGLQFVVSTHSALLLNYIPSKHIWLLDDWKTVRPDATFGRDISTIISKVMDTPSNEFEKKYKKIYRLLSRNEIVKAEANLKEIEDTFKASGDDYSPELRKLLAILDRKKILEK